MKSLSRFLSTLVLFLVLQGGIIAQHIESLPLDNRLPVLNEKAFFTFPTNAVNSARQANLMSADFNINEETRIVLDLENMKLVFFAEELHAFGSDNLFSQMSKTPGKLNYTYKKLTEEKELLSILSTPSVFDSTKNAILVNSLMVRTADNTLFRINAYINPEAFQLKDQFITLSERVFSSLSKGTRKSDLSARKERFKILGMKKEFVFDLPQNYCITVDQKYDFQVFKFHRYADAFDTNWVSLTIYAGHHPSTFAREYGFNEASATKDDGTFLGKKMEWLSYSNRDGQLYMREQIIPGDKVEKDLKLHVAMMSNQPATISELCKIVEAVKLD